LAGGSAVDVSALLAVIANVRAVVHCECTAALLFAVESSSTQTSACTGATPVVCRSASDATPLGAVVLRLETNEDDTSFVGLADSAAGATDTAKIVCQVVKWCASLGAECTVA
jgi:hypothetical protein